MTVLHHNHVADTVRAPEQSEGANVLAHRALGALRIAFGFTFLWAFIDKTFALGYHTGVDPTGTLDRFGSAAWIHGGSPTEGFLKFGANGPFDGFYHSIAGAAITDWLFMLGLLGIGTALILGIGMRAACAAGVVMYLMMWSVVMPPETKSSEQSAWSCSPP
jgi:thiosulfate dehydrogenase [quinone] large subunit